MDTCMTSLRGSFEILSVQATRGSYAVVCPKSCASKYLVLILSPSQKRTNISNCSFCNPWLRLLSNSISYILPLTLRSRSSRKCEPYPWVIKYMVFVLPQENLSAIGLSGNICLNKMMCFYLIYKRNKYLLHNTYAFNMSGLDTKVPSEYDRFVLALGIDCEDEGELILVTQLCILKLFDFLISTRFS